MKSIVRNTAILTIFSFIAYNNAELTDCQNVVCPELDTYVTCPPDSKLIVIDPQHKLEPINFLTVNIDKISNTENLHNKHVLARRSLGKIRRESIKIVPGLYIHKRSIEENNNNLKDDELRIKCCPQKKCVCKWECEVPECEGELKPIGNLTSGNPGECCPKFSCQIPPNCEELPDDYLWVQPCQSCRCLSNQTFCHMSQCPEEKKAKCKADNGSNYYLHNEQWMEDPCTSCICRNGKIRCEQSVCLTPSCPKIIQLPGECCPICDYNGTNFCNENINCEIACEFDYVKSSTGCKLCKCEKSKQITTTSIPIKDIDNNRNYKSTTISNIDEKEELIERLINDKNNLNQIITYLCMVIIAFTILSIVLAFKLFSNYKQNRMYKTVPSSVDSNLNNIPKSIHTEKT